MPPLAEIYEAALTTARGDIEAARDRAAFAASLHIQRRLWQLERRFGGHRFMFMHRDRGACLFVAPPVCGSDSVASFFTYRRWRIVNRWPGLRQLHTTHRELEAVGHTVVREFHRKIGLITSRQHPDRVWPENSTSPVTQAYESDQAAARAAWLANASPAACAAADPVTISSLPSTFATL